MIFIIKSIHDLFTKRNGLLTISLFFLFSISTQSNEISSQVGVKHYSILKEKNSYKSNFSQSYFKTEITGYSINFDWKLKLRYQKPTGGVEWGNLNNSIISDTTLSGFIGNVHFRDESFGGEISVFDKSNSLGINVHWKDNFQNENDYAGSIFWNKFGPLSGKVKIGRKHLFPSHSKVYYKYFSDAGQFFEGGRINWIAPIDYTQISFVFKPLDRFQLNYYINDMSFNPKEPLDEQSSNDIYEGHLSGEVDERKISVGYTLGLNTLMQFDERKIVIDSRLQGFYRNRIFAHFGILEGSFEYQQVSITQEERKISFCDGELRGELKGAVEAWPFLNGLLRFIGERRHIIGSMQIDWMKLSIKDRLFTMKRYKLSGAIDLYRVKPKLNYTTWRPILFGFGIDDLKKGELSIESADLCHIKFDTQLNFKQVLVNIHLAQIIPLNLKKIKKGETDPGNGGGANPSEHIQSPKTTGGFDASVILKYNF